MASRKCNLSGLLFMAFALVLLILGGKNSDYVALAATVCSQIWFAAAAILRHLEKVRG
jgi:hypothetical protein